MIKGLCVECGKIKDVKEFFLFDEKTKKGMCKNC